MIRLSELRKSKGLSQKQLAEKLSIAQNTLSQYETGKRDPDTETLKRIGEFFNVSIDFILGNEHNTEKRKGIKIPVLGRVQAGIPVEAVEEIIDYEEIIEEMANQGEYFALQVRGDSMEPKFSEGDVVIVLKQPTAETGDIAIVLVNGNDATIKKIKRTEQGIMLIPLNSDYEIMFYSNEEIEQLPVRILGKVVELRAKF